MRIWSLHPKYLDAKGLVALWRETLLAKHVLEGKTKGYTQHPQLKRFKQCSHPLDAINQYLAEVHIEAAQRNYNFDRQKVNWNYTKCKLPVTNKQLAYEVGHLMNKLMVRDEKRHAELSLKKIFDTHPLFDVVDGEVEDWEIFIR